MKKKKQNTIVHESSGTSLPIVFRVLFRLLRNWVIFLFMQTRVKSSIVGLQ